jgi:hypothetical protein
VRDTDGGGGKHLEVTEATCYRWRNQYGEMKADDATWLKELGHAFLEDSPGKGSRHESHFANRGSMLIRTRCPIDTC